MRIIYLVQYFFTPDMPGSSRAYEMARRLVRWGHQVEVVTADRSASARAFETEEAGARVHWLPVPYSNTMSARERLAAFLKFSYLAGHKAASLGGDVVLASSTPLTIALPAVYTAKRKGVPMVFEVRDLWPEVPIAMGVLRGAPAISAARWLERFAYRHAAQVVALSPGMKAGVVKTGYPEGRVHVIPNAADLELFDVPASQGRAFRQRYDWLGARPLVVYAGTLGRVNGVSYLAQVARAVLDIDPEVRFVTVGGGPEFHRVRALAAELGVLNRNFYMLDKVPKRDMPEVLCAADIATSLVIDLPALWENSANKFFDGLAAGTAFAVNHGGWQAQLLEDNRAGLVLERDATRAAGALLGALHDPRWLAEAGRNARRLAAARFSREALAKALEGVLSLAYSENTRPLTPLAAPRRGSRAPTRRRPPPQRSASARKDGGSSER